MAKGFFFNEDYATPESIDRRRALINALAKDNLSTAPVGHWTQALARVLGAGADQYESAKLSATEKKSVEENKAALMAAFGGLGGGVTPTAMPSAGAALPSSQPAPATNAPAPVPRETIPPGEASLGPSSGPGSGGGSGPVSPLPPVGKPAPPAWAGSMAGAQQSFAPPAQPQAQAAPASDGRPSEQELVLRTIAAETYDKSPQEAQAIAAVILNRAKSRGLSPADVVLEKNQFEPWNAGPGGRNDPMAIDPNSPRMAQAAQALQAAMAGQDPTKGATHFFAPQAQAALGRPPPAWANGQQGQQIGATAFYAPEGRVAGGAIPSGSVPQAPAAAMPSQAPVAPGQPPAAPQQPGINPALLAALSSPWAQRNPMLAQLGMGVAQQQIAGNKLQYQTDGEGNIIALDPTGRRPPTVVHRAAVKPINVPEGGKLVVPDASAPGGYREVATGGDKQSTELKNYNEAIKGGFKGTFAEYQVMLKRAGSAQPENTFNVEMSKGQAKQFTEMSGEYPAARSDLANVKALREQLGRLPGGFLGNAQAMAVRMGVKIGTGAGAVEAADAILNRLTPAQRQGMPGAASDRDVAMFRGSLPSLGNSKEGQKIILDTMESLATYKLQQAEIAQAVAMGKMKPEQAMEALSKLSDPFETFKKIQGQQASPQTGTVRVNSAAEAAKLPKGTRFIDPNGVERIVP